MDNHQEPVFEPNQAVQEPIFEPDQAEEEIRYPEVPREPNLVVYQDDEVIPMDADGERENQEREPVIINNARPAENIKRKQKKKNKSQRQDQKIQQLIAEKISLNNDYESIFKENLRIKSSLNKEIEKGINNDLKMDKLERQLRKAETDLLEQTEQKKKLGLKVIDLEEINRELNARNDQLQERFYDEEDTFEDAYAKALSGALQSQKKVHQIQLNEKQEILDQKNSALNKKELRIQELMRQNEIKDDRIKNFRRELLRLKTFITDKDLDENFSTFVKGNF